ncbi:helix-turn-helix domain-containing protein [Methylomonas sp. LL1]|uniref:helix-turn-helix domain-containing protein n=1 Tax=Methylomonas sp. LL1 TaxID=2785785 RepID=UPI0018C40D8D|nr:helix-turn-helix domain-containing protein [Methylomonas sp. LL1]QPK65146.1 helix-turn-helix domain-containing protein [Methylomonas sp. LL1]
MKKTANILSETPIKGPNPEISEERLLTMGARVRHYRERLGLSQDELALRVGAAQQTIQSLESGKIRKSTFLPHIARELGVDFDTLLFGTPLPVSRPLSMANAGCVPLFATRDCELVQAFLQSQTVQSPSGKWVTMDYSLPFAESGSRLFALKLGLSDEAFQPEFRPGDQLLIDPDAPIQPSDPVVVFKPGAERLNLFRYRVLSQSGTDVDYELVSIHPDFPSLAGSELRLLQILGPVIQMRRPISSRVRLAVLEEQYR